MGSLRRVDLRFVVAAGMLIAVVAVVAAYRAFLLARLAGDVYLGIYGMVAASYMLTRFALALCYRAPRDRGIDPTIALVMPAFNEQEAIGTSLRSLLAVDYPAKKLQIVAINDGSTDGTLAELTAAAERSDGRIRVINFTRNKGKRAAMAAGIKATDAEIVAFVDSDSTLEHDALRKIVQPFADRRVGAVCGHAAVSNARTSWLTKMQAVRYCLAFRVIKASESLFSAVTCCSGCFSAYRREAVTPRLDWWQNQIFLGRPATIGDDRSLTNCVLRGWRVTYHADAVSRTIVPATARGYVRQQTRWKRSWTRESLRAAAIIWRKHPAAAIATYLSIVMPLAAPLTAVRSVASHRILGGVWQPLVLAGGVSVMALVASLLYVVRTRSYDTVWIHGLSWVLVYVALMMWLTYYAIITCRSSSWGTRASNPATQGGAPSRALRAPLAFAQAARSHYAMTKAFIRVRVRGRGMRKSADEASSSHREAACSSTHPAEDPPKA